MRRFFIEYPAETGDAVVLSTTDSKHIHSVLRLKPGTDVLLFDGTGTEYEARIVAVSSKGVSVSILSRIIAESESPVFITVAQGYLKEKKMDGLVRSLTELGINRWIPFFAERSVPRPSEHRISTKSERWRTIAREALKQCRRSRLPEILEAGSFDDVIALSKGSELKIAFWEKAVDKIPAVLTGEIRETNRRLFVLLGPEGGLTDTEIRTARAAGFKALTLGPRILRAETATVAACSLMQFLLGDLGSNRGTVNTST